LWCLNTHGKPNEFNRAAMRKGPLISTRTHSVKRMAGGEKKERKRALCLHCREGRHAGAHDSPGEGLNLLREKGGCFLAENKKVGSISSVSEKGSITIRRRSRGGR